MLLCATTYNSAALDGFLQNLAMACDINEAMDVLQHTGAELGLPLVDYASMPTARRMDGTWTSPQMMTRNFPHNWDRKYERHRPHDPYFHACYNGAHVVDWSTIQASRDKLNTFERDCLDHISDVGLVCGLTVPIHMAGSRFSFVSMIGAPNGRSDVPKDDTVRNTAFLIAHHFHSNVQARFGTKAGEVRIPLSTRERQCLGWSAEGRTIEDIAAILNLSNETVRTYLKRVTRKLSSLNRTHAVAKAISLGLIDPPQPLPNAEGESDETGNFSGVRRRAGEAVWA